jgi:hypothetical protein
MKITPRRQLGVELQKAAKTGHFYWRPANSIGAQSEISYSIFSRLSLFVASC